MACSKYVLTNTGSTLVNFSYQRCDDFMWEYQVELTPGQTKNIWLNDGTFSIAESFNALVVLTDEGVFPPPPSATPTPSVTPTQTTTPVPTATVTPSVTPTNTPSAT